VRHGTRIEKVVCEAAYALRHESFSHRSAPIL
jgi:hypothetical protein